MARMTSIQVTAEELSILIKAMDKLGDKSNEAVNLQDMLQTELRYITQTRWGTPHDNERCRRCVHDTVPATYVVRDGDVMEIVCTRHLTDAIEEAAFESNLTRYDTPLEVKPLRLSEND